MLMLIQKQLNQTDFYFNRIEMKKLANIMLLTIRLISVIYFSWRNSIHRCRTILYHGSEAMTLIVNKY